MLELEVASKCSISCGMVQLATTDHLHVASPLQGTTGKQEKQDSVTKRILYSH